MLEGHMTGDRMTGKELFSKSSPILFGVRLANGSDLVERVRRAHEAGADFVGMEHAGRARHERLEAVFSALTAPSALAGPCGKTGLCLFPGEEFEGDIFGDRAPGADLPALVERHAQKLPLLVAGPDKTLLAALEKRFPHLATALVLSGNCACNSMQEQVGGGEKAPGTDKDPTDASDIGEGIARCVLSRDLASGCRLCGLRSMGVYALVAGSFTRQDIVRMSLDGADAFLLDDAANLEAVAARKRRRG